jgi:hypothetical protein
VRGSYPPSYMNGSIEREARFVRMGGCTGRLIFRKNGQIVLVLLDFWKRITPLRRTSKGSQA